jgi:hypothetical protein
VESLIQSLVTEHRIIEGELDRLTQGVMAGAVDVSVFRRARELCIRHFAREEAFLARLGERDASLESKLRGQHDEALELATRAEEAVLAGQASDLMYLVRRFLAITQHNIIEEERDVFPFLADL